jgi:hypothetical protein
MLLALITGLVACGGSEARGPDPLFDTARSDVSSFKGEDGRDIGLVNTTHGVLWDYEHGYSRFGANREVVWGPLASFPDGELASMQATDVPQSKGDGVGSTSMAMISGGGGGGTVCTCCYVRIDGTCGCLECRTK